VICTEVRTKGINRHHDHLRVRKLGSSTALGETSVRAPWVDAERASSVGICLGN